MREQHGWSVYEKRIKEALERMVDGHRKWAVQTNPEGEGRTELVM